MRALFNCKEVRRAFYRTLIQYSNEPMLWVRPDLKALHNLCVPLRLGGKRKQSNRRGAEYSKATQR